MTTIDARPARQLTSALPLPRGPLSESVVEYVTGRSARLWSQRGDAPLDDADGQLALWMLHCLDIAVDWDIDPERARAVPLQLLHLDLARSFEAEVQRLVPPARDGHLEGRFDDIRRSPSIDVAATAAELGPTAICEAVAADAPHLGFAGQAHTLALARLEAPLQPVVAELQADALGVGAEQTHAQLYRGCLTALGVSYTDAVASAPTAALAFANLCWMFGREVRWRGAAVGQLCLLALDAASPSPAHARAWRDPALPPAVRRWHDVRSSSGARHERLVRERLLPTMRSRTPWLAADAAFGAEATWTLRQRVAAELVARWRT